VIGPARPGVRDVALGEGVRLADFVNLYECEIGDHTRVGAFVEVQGGARIGRNVKLGSHSFVCEGVTIEDDVFVGHHVSFINDRYPRATVEGRPQGRGDWVCVPTRVCRGASLGTGAIILCGVTIGEHAVVGAGSVVTRDVPARTVVAGVPARPLRTLDPGQAAAAPAPAPPAPALGSVNGHAAVPLVDLKAQYRAIRGEIRRAVDDVLEGGTYVLGDEVRAFEAEFAAYCGTAHAVAVSSGTSALHLALLAAGVGPQDEVITVPFTFAATVAAVLYTGARPVLVDVEPGSLTMDPARVEAAVTPRTRAILPVHLHGQPADMHALGAIARRHRLALIEDAAQAHGAEYEGRRAGSLGDLGCFSFYPGKNLGAYGEGGIVVTRDPAHARTLGMLRDWGQEQKYVHRLRGFNYRMETLQGAVLRVKLRHLPAWTAARRARAARYDRLLAGLPLEPPATLPGRRHVYHVYAIRVRNRDAVGETLARHSVHIGIHYPRPVHLQPAYADLGYGAGDFPHSEAAAGEVLSLPLYPELTDELQDRVVAAVREAVA
jgi:dTDP-4-amino-4,6-dideoxygalactose transaminase/acetyltransferase-like isoleucine patch superfamily enzyme